MRTLNLGILAHVDAGKTSLTERLLHAAGVIDEIGSVDRGNTQTDTLALEQQRGITIKSAVVSFAIDGVTVNLIDTPGHPDFIAEVERVLSVLDGAVLVISAVEGVQSQTRVLIRTLQRLGIPTLIFVNKIDRAGAEHERVLDDIGRKLTPSIIAMGSTDARGSSEAAFMPYCADHADFSAKLVDLLADHDEAFLAAYVNDEAAVSDRELRHKLAGLTAKGLVHPVYFGSAITGAGVDALIAGVAELLPATEGRADGPLSASVFKIDRGPTGEKIAYARIFSGTLGIRDRLKFGAEGAGTVTRVHVFDDGADIQRPSVAAGEIAKLWGLADIQIGDTLGEAGACDDRRHFAPPTLETVVVPRRQEERRALHTALTQLAEQDPLINLRRDETRQELLLSLYGEVQKEVIEQTLASDFGIEVEFSETTTICVERPAGIGEAVEILNAESNPFLATIGMRIEPAPFDSGIEFRLDVDANSAPLFIYKNLESFADMMEQYARQTLREGIYGWQVTDCIVTMNQCVYSSWDGPPSTRGPLSTAADFRKLTPLVVMAALEQAGTLVCEPVQRFYLEVPAETLGAVLSALPRLGVIPEAPASRGESYVLEGEIPVAQVHALQQHLPGLTRGEGVLECAFEGYAPVQGEHPTRPRSDHNPLNRKEYLLHVQRGL